MKSVCALGLACTRLRLGLRVKQFVGNFLTQIKLRSRKNCGSEFALGMRLNQRVGDAPLPRQVRVEGSQGIVVTEEELLVDCLPGDSFHSPDEGKELSYHLSQVLFRNLMADFPQKIDDLLNTAHYSDAGNQALQQLCKVSLGERVSQFLGEGEWQPSRSYSELE